MTKCPSKFTDTARRRRPDLPWPSSAGLPDPRPRHVRLRHRRRRSTARARAGATGSTRAAARSTRWRAADDRGLRGPRDRLPALGLPLRRRRHALVDDDADLLHGRRRVVLAGGLAAAVGVAAVAVVEPRALPRRAGACATSRPTRPRCCWASARSSPALLVFAASPFDTRRARAGRGHGPEPAAAPPEHDDPPPDALLGVHAVRGARSPSRSGRWSCGASTPSGSARRAASRWPPGSSSASGSCSARAGPTPSSGWGGYWAWDPVENASLLPWLTGTAFLHSVMIQEKRGMLKVWNVVARAGDRHARDPRHVPRALGHPRLDPRLRRLDARRARSSSLIGADDRGLDRTSSSRAATSLRSEHRLDSLLSREAMFLRQQPRPRRRWPSSSSGARSSR